MGVSNRTNFTYQKPTAMPAQSIPQHLVVKPSRPARRLRTILRQVPANRVQRALRLALQRRPARLKQKIQHQLLAIQSRNLPAMKLPQLIRKMEMMLRLRPPVIPMLARPAMSQQKTLSRSPEARIPRRAHLKQERTMTRSLRARMVRVSKLSQAALPRVAAIPKHPMILVITLAVIAQMVTAQAAQTAQKHPAAKTRKAIKNHQMRQKPRMAITTTR